MVYRKVEENLRIVSDEQSRRIKKGGGFYLTWVANVWHSKINRIFTTLIEVFLRLLFTPSLHLEAVRVLDPARFVTKRLPISVNIIWSICYANGNHANDIASNNCRTGNALSILGAHIRTRSARPAGDRMPGGNCNCTSHLGHIFVHPVLKAPRMDWEADHVSYNPDYRSRRSGVETEVLYTWGCTVRLRALLFSVQLYEPCCVEKMFSRDRKNIYVPSAG